MYGTEVGSEAEAYLVLISPFRSKFDRMSNTQVYTTHNGDGILRMALLRVIENSTAPVRNNAQIHIYEDEGQPTEDRIACGCEVEGNSEGKKMISGKWESTKNATSQAGGTSLCMGSGWITREVKGLAGGKSFRL
jgi:hypothetical protein